MFQNSYKDYMNYLLGYSCNDNTGCDCNSMITYEAEEEDDDNYIELYPEIYQMVYPMVCKACMNTNVQGTITKEMVMEITNEIYEALDEAESPELTTGAEVKVTYSNGMNYRHHRGRRESVHSQAEERETRQRNELLNDIIRILVLRELLGNRRPPMPPRPPMRPIPPRPPFPGGGPKPPRM